MTLTSFLALQEDLNMWEFHYKDVSFKPFACFTRNWHIYTFWTFPRVDFDFMLWILLQGVKRQLTNDKFSSNMRYVVKQWLDRILYNCDRFDMYRFWWHWHLFQGHRILCGGKFWTSRRFLLKLALTYHWDQRNS